MLDKPFLINTNTIKRGQGVILCKEKIYGIIFLFKDQVRFEIL